MLFKLIFILPIFLFPSRSNGQQKILQTIVEKIETEVKPALAAAYLNCTCAFLTGNSIVNWIRLSDSKIISQNQDIQVQNKPDSLGQLKYEVNSRPGRSPAVPLGYGTALTTYMLTIRQLQEDDAGLYRCQISQQGAVAKDYPYRDGLLVVLRAPQIVVSLSTTIVETVEGSSFNLSCYADGIPKPNITWQRGTGQPFQNGLERWKGNVVPLVNVTRNDRGVYRCYSQNNVGMAAFYDSFVKIRFPPTARPLRVGGYYGQAPDRNYEVMFECVTTGYPDPDVDWYQVGVKDPLKDSTRYEIEKLVSQGSAYLQFDDRIMTLRIRNVMSQDFGTYICSATNKYGSSNTSIEFFYLPTCQGAVCPLEGSRGSAFGLRAIPALLAITALALLVALLHH